MVKNYIPEQGDIIYTDFSPTKGHEQKSNRPALVLSTYEFNKFTKLVIICPITSNTKFFPTHYELQDSKKIHGSVLCEHIRSIDYETKNVNYIEKASKRDYDNTYNLLSACFNS